MSQSRAIAERVDRGIQRFLEGLAGLALFLMMLLTAVDVGSRYFLGTPLLGAVELTQLLLAAMVFLAFPVICWREEHIAIDLLDPVFPDRLVWLRQMVLNLAATAALWIMTPVIWNLAARALRWNDVTQYLRIPEGYMIGLMAVMAAFAGLLTLIRAWLYLLEGLGRRPRGGPQSPSVARGEGRRE